LSICLNYDIIYKTGVGNLDEHENLEQQTQEEQKLRQWWHPSYPRKIIIREEYHKYDKTKQRHIIISDN